MSVQKLTRAGGTVYRARIKSHGVEVATKVFDKRKDAVAWEQEQRQRLRAGTWIDPARGRITFDALAADWLAARQGTVKRRTFESDEGAWRRYIQPRFGRREVHSVTAAEVSVWMGELSRKGLARSTINRALAVLRLLLQFAVEDKRVQVNVAAQVRPPTGGRVRREAQVLSLHELHVLAEACETQWSDVILVLGLQGLRWGELAGLQVGDVTLGERPAIRVSRTVLASGGGGEQYIDTVKNHRARTVPLVAESAQIIERWTVGKGKDDWLFAAPAGGALREGNWKRLVRWPDGLKAIERPGLRVHDLRHTAASLWLSVGADPKVVQRVLGHASATMTMDLYGHLVDGNLWAAADLVGRA